MLLAELVVLVLEVAVAEDARSRRRANGVEHRLGGVAAPARTPWPAPRAGRSTTPDAAEVEGEHGDRGQDEQRRA